jgi:hypothetical protein
MSAASGLSPQLLERACHLWQNLVSANPKTNHNDSHSSSGSDTDSDSIYDDLSDSDGTSARVRSVPFKFSDHHIIFPNEDVDVHRCMLLAIEDVHYDKVQEKVLHRTH